MDYIMSYFYPPEIPNGIEEVIFPSAEEIIKSYEIIECKPASHKLQPAQAKVTNHNLSQSLTQADLNHILAGLKPTVTKNNNNFYTSPLITELHQKFRNKQY
jgi:hypothetical protein